MYRTSNCLTRRKKMPRSSLPVSAYEPVIAVGQRTKKTGLPADKHDKSRSRQRISPIGAGGQAVGQRLDISGVNGESDHVDGNHDGYAGQRDSTTTLHAFVNTNNKFIVEVDSNAHQEVMMLVDTQLGFLLFKKSQGGIPEETAENPGD
ncbi:hypothetical protein Hypma_002252 [Hypsizygus marmoreus]|uniref:Uncharacterized protein n=1 Tax=Hypsizygus marmoreus TaxID=39966 RepID=A0A369KAC9_HYPMA|nr:hypothetical protein Hypma_002252 [Hypsizygus marmoreus]